MSTLYEIPKDKYISKCIKKLDEEFIDQLPNKLLDKKLKSMDFYDKLKYGDVIHFEDFGNYRNDGKVMFDGKKIIHLDCSYIDYGTVPKEFPINRFATVKYFDETISHNGVVWLERSPKINLVEINDDLFKFETYDGYIIHTTNEDFQIEYMKNAIRMYETHPDIMDCNANIELLIKNDDTTKILFDFENL